jgi:hypothetical protein
MLALLQLKVTNFALIALLMSSHLVSCPGGSAAASALVPAPAVQPSASGTPALVPVSIQALPVPTAAGSVLDDFPMDGLPMQHCRELIDADTVLKA